MSRKKSPQPSKDAATTEPVVTEPVVTEPVVTEPVVTEPEDNAPVMAIPQGLGEAPAEAPARGPEIVKDADGNITQENF